MNMLAEAAPFEWSDSFSDKQIKLMTWWTPESPYRDWDMLIADGSIRSGKTIGMITSFILWSQATFKDKNFILAGKSMGALKRNVVEEMKKICASLGIPFKQVRSENPHVIIGHNIYYLFGASNEASQDTLQGLTAAGAYADEAALMPQSFINQMIGRCSIDGAKIFMNCNPGGPKHFLKVEYIDKAKEKKILRLHFTLDDNPSLAERIKDRYKRMFRGVFFQRYILGLWVLAEGVVYADHYNPDMHIVPRAKIEAMIRDGAFKAYGAGTDFGFTHPMTGLLFGITKKNEYYQIAEFYKTQQKTEALGQWYLDWEKKIEKKIEVIFCDNAEPDRIVTLAAMGLNAKAVPTKEIMAGINSVMDTFIEDRLFISEDCVQTDNELQTYRFPNEDDKENLKKKDLPLDENNHAMDGMRYFVHPYNMYLIGQDKRDKKREERVKRSLRRKTF